MLETWPKRVDLYHVLTKVQHSTGIPATPVGYPGTWTGTDTRTGSNRPNWKRLIAMGEQAGTAFTGNLYERSDVFGAIGFETRRKSDGLEGFTRQAGCLTYNVTMPVLNPDLLSLARNQASEKFYAKAWEVIRRVNGGLFLAEIRKTYATIRNPAMLLRQRADNLYGALKEVHRRKRGKSWRRDLAGTYLEKTFGWAPLIKDIGDGVAGAIELKERFGIEVVEANAKTYSFTTGYSPWHGGTNLLDWRFSGITKKVATVRYKAGVKMTIDEEVPAGDWHRTFGLTLNEVVPTAWEMIPWSFVADYFTNVGKVLDALAFPSNHLAWCVSTTRNSAEVHLLECAITKSTVENTISPALYDIHYTQPSGRGRYYVRTVGRSLENPVLPRIRVRTCRELNPSRFLNIAALLEMRRRPT